MRASRWIMVALFAVSVVVVVEAQQPRQGGFGQLNTTNLVVSNKDLQEELKITDAQKEKLKPLADKISERQKKQQENFKNGGFKNFDKEKFEELRKESEAFNAEVKKGVEEVLTPEQKKRLSQIELQARGLRAFSDEKVAKELNITEAQTSKIKGIMEEYQKDTKELGFGGGKGGFDKEKAAENAKKREKLSKTAMADIEETLTPDQKNKWKEMVGAPFDVSKLRQGGFGGFGGRNNKTKD
jgi:Spy/CpxP family protein refolding chaperone